ncbi:hypothetical protein FB451DRAFT_1537882 [Mycena latifolia]|nr:hypothetical protein FB451DRAFT_1537882 [Mycena latifolia]
MAVSVPVFVCYRYERGEPRRSERDSAPVRVGLLKGTSTTEEIGAHTNGFQFIVRREHFPIRLSSSLLLEERYKAQTSMVELPATASAEMPPQRPTFLPPPLQLEIVATDRVPWIRPPARTTGLGKGKWEKWVQYELMKATPPFYYLRKGAHNWQPSSKHLVCYDRVLHRELYLRGHHLWPLGIVDVQTHGAPVPRERYFKVEQKRGNAEYSEHRPSHWIYLSRTCLQGEAGMVAKQPDPSLLPHADGSDSYPPPTADYDEGGSEDDNEPGPPPPDAGTVQSTPSRMPATVQEGPHEPHALPCLPPPAPQPARPVPSPATLTDIEMPSAADDSARPAAASQNPVMDDRERAVGADAMEDDLVSLDDVSDEEETAEAMPQCQYDYWVPYKWPPMLHSSLRWADLQLRGVNPAATPHRDTTRWSLRTFTLPSTILLLLLCPLSLPSSLSSGQTTTPVLPLSHFMGMVPTFQQEPPLQSLTRSSPISHGASSSCKSDGSQRPASHLGVASGAYWAK